MKYSMYLNTNIPCLSTSIPDRYVPQPVLSTNGLINQPIRTRNCFS